MEDLIIENWHEKQKVGFFISLSSDDSRVLEVILIILVLNHKTDMSRNVLILKFVRGEWIGRLSSCVQYQQSLFHVLLPPSSPT